MKVKALIYFGIVLILISSLFCSTSHSKFRSSWPENTTRFWIGPEYWSNRLQDWQLNAGRLECIDGTKPLRTVHLITHSLLAKAGELEMSVRMGSLSDDAKLDENAWSGFLIGAGSEDLDYRARAIIHRSTGENGGLVAALDGKGQIIFYDNADSLKPMPVASRKGEPIGRSTNEDLELKLIMKPLNENYTMTLSINDHKSGSLLSEATIEKFESSRLTGNIALVANGGADETGASFWFRDWKVSGSKLAINKKHQFGLILCALHTLSNRVLKMTVQMPPIAKSDPQTVQLQITQKGTSKWRTIAEEKLIVPGWTTTFRIPDWDDTQDYDYRVVYSMPNGKGKLQDYYYTGTIRHNPVEKAKIVVAAFTGNSNTLGSYSDYYSFTKNRLWFPHADIVQHVKAHKPDLLVYTGDQVYEGRPTHPDRSGKFSSYLDYLYKWYLFCWAHGELARDIPIVCMPDDHDVYHGNIWGSGGIKAREYPRDGNYPAHYRGFEGHWRQDGGGYVMPPEFVKMVERTQTSHLPDPYDPTPVAQDIRVYYTAMNYGGISFAILEDRKFKSAPSVMIPDGKVVNGFFQNPDFDVRKADVPGAKLLGDRQLKFLREWAADWQGAWMKVAVSQTLLANLSTYPDYFKTNGGTPALKPAPFGVIPEGYKLAKDMDSNGWPQTGRNKALHELRRGFAFMIAGDQHLGSIVHHGIDEWNDAGFSLCVPSIANLWPRRWYPPKPGHNHQPGMPAYTGSYLDGFGNHITVWTVSNPVISNHEPAELHDRAPGYGIARLNKKEQQITIECWPRYADPTNPGAQQYPGWPMTISLEDNYGRQAKVFLPTLKFMGLENPVVQIIDESINDIVYTIRAKSEPFRAKVYKSGFYTIKVGEPGTKKMKTLTNIHSLGKDEQKTLDLEF